MLDLGDFDLEEIADALADQWGSYEHHMLVDPKTGEMVFWSADTGIGGHNPLIDEAAAGRYQASHPDLSLP